jgi:spore germination protein KC
MKKLFFLPLLLLLAGCWDTHQSERMYYIHALGFDYQNEEYKIYAQIIDFTNIAKTEQPNPEATQVEIGTAHGRTFEEAFFNLYNSMDERLFLGHLSHVIFSENVVKENKSQTIVNAFIRYRELRYTSWVYITKSPLEEIIKVTPILNKSITLSKLANPLNSYNQSSLIRPIQLRELMIQLDEPSHEAHIPYIEIADNWSTPKEKDTVYLFSGMGIISKNTGLKGYLLKDDVKGLQWLSDKSDRAEVTVKFPVQEDQYTTIIVNKITPEIRPMIEGNDIQFDLTIKLEVRVNELPDQQQKKRLYDAIEKEVKKQIETTYRSSLEKDIDIYRLSEVAFRKKLKNWKRVEKDGKIPLSEASIRSLNVELTRIIGERTITEKK